MRIQNYALVTIAVAATAACSADGHREPPTERDGDLERISQAQTIPSIDTTGKRAGLLGSGYDPGSDQFRARCLIPKATGGVVYGGAAESELKMDKALSISDVSSDLHVAVGGKATFAAFSIEAKVSFDIGSQETSNSVSVIFGYRVKGKNAILNDAELDPRVITAVNAAGADDDARQKAFEAMCGSQYVDQVQLGGQVWASARFDFANSSLKSKFSASLKADIMKIITIEGEITNDFKQLLQGATVTVSAYQLGGSPENLAQILTPLGAAPSGEASADKMSIDSGLALQCTGDKIQDCAKALTAVGNYANNQFRAQLGGFNYDETKASGTPAITRYQYADFRNSPLAQTIYRKSPPQVGLEAERTRAEFLTKYFKYARDVKRAQTLKLFFRLTKEEQDRIAAVETKAINILRQIVFSATNCFNDQTTCTQQSVDLNNTETINAYAASDLDKQPTFVDYCNGVDNAAQVLGDDERTVVNAPTTATIAGIQHTLGLDNGSCEDVARALANPNLKLLDLSFDATKRKISDLRPLFGLKNIQAIYLDENLVTNVIALGDVPNLKYLSVRGNQIPQFALFGMIPHLAWLDASQNQIRSLQGISQLQELTALYVRDNPIDDFSVLDTLLNLTTKVIDNKDVCKAEIRWLVNNGKLSDEDALMYRAAGLAPNYNKASDRTSGIEGWYACDGVANSLPAARVRPPAL